MVRVRRLQILIIVTHDCPVNIFLLLGTYILISFQKFKSEHFKSSIFEKFTLIKHRKLLGESSMVG